MLNIQMQTHSNAEYSNIEYSNVEYSNVEHSIFDNAILHWKPGLFYICTLLLSLYMSLGSLMPRRHFAPRYQQPVYTCHWAPWCPGAILHQDISSTLTSQNNTLIITNIIFHISYHHNIISGPCRAGYPALQRQATPQHSATENITISNSLEFTHCLKGKYPCN